MAEWWPGDKIDGASKNTTAMMDPWTERCGRGLEGGQKKRKRRMMRMSMVRWRRILPTYLAQQCLHLVGVTLNREQQIRVAGAGGAGCLRFKLKPTNIGECTAHTINSQVS